MSFFPSVFVALFILGSLIIVGFVIPYLISAASSELVVAGFVLIAIYCIFVYEVILSPVIRSIIGSIKSNKGK